MVAVILHSACASLCDISNVSTKHKVLIRQLRNHALQKHLQSGGYTSASQAEGRQFDPGQVYHLAKSRTQTLIGPATR